MDPVFISTRTRRIAKERIMRTTAGDFTSLVLATLVSTWFLERDGDV